MFFTYAEKQKDNIFGRWTMREVAFDTIHRYLYYSDDEVPDNMMCSTTTYNSDMSPTTPNSPGFPGYDRIGRARLLDDITNPSRPPLVFDTAPPPPHSLKDLNWKVKMKVDFVVPIGREHKFLLSDPHVKESDLYQLEISGTVRSMGTETCPPAGPLLCPSTGLSGMPFRMTMRNEEYLRDPCFLRELYESLRTTFANLRLAQETEALSQGRNPADVKPHTLVSPKSKGAATRKKILLRLRSNYDFRRFLYVVQTVLGYDKIIQRPYRGLPPYDPRNGIMFARIPMYVWHTFKSLDKAVIYSFLSGSIVEAPEDRSMKGYTTRKNAFLCISHDTVFALRDTGHIIRWISFNHICKFYYNFTGGTPYFAFISDPGYPDIIFIPQPPTFGTESIRSFHPNVEVLMVQRVVHEACFASVIERRVIQLIERKDSWEKFVEAQEAEGLVFQFVRSTLPDSAVNCPLPKEELGDLWRDVQHLYTEMNAANQSRVAVPLYDNNTNEIPLDREQIQIISERLEHRRGKKDQIVGMSYEHAQQMETDAPPDADEDIYRPIGEQGISENTSFAFPTSSNYITRNDLATRDIPPKNVLMDHHAILMGTTPTNLSFGTRLEPEISMEGIMAVSFSNYQKNTPRKKNSNLPSQGHTVNSTEHHAHPPQAVKHQKSQHYDVSGSHVEHHSPRPHHRNVSGSHAQHHSPRPHHRDVSGSHAQHHSPRPHHRDVSGSHAQHHSPRPHHRDVSGSHAQHHSPRPHHADVSGAHAQHHSPRPHHADVSGAHAQHHSPRPHHRDVSGSHAQHHSPRPHHRDVSGSHAQHHSPQPHHATHQRQHSDKASTHSQKKKHPVAECELET